MLYALFILAGLAAILLGFVIYFSKKIGKLESQIAQKDLDLATKDAQFEEWKKAQRKADEIQNSPTSPTLADALKRV